MSTKSNELYRLLDSSSEDMLLYFQGLAWHLEGDVAALSNDLSLLFANEAVKLGDKDEHQEGTEVSAEILEKVKQFKKLAEQNKQYKRFAAKYGEKAAKTLLGLLTMRFTSYPAGYGADDYVAIVGHLFTSDSELQAILLPQYPKVARVVNYVISKTSTETESEEFRKTFAAASEKVADSHIFSSVAQARYLNVVTEKDRETINIVGVLSVMDAQFRSCFNPFFQEKSQLAGATQKMVTERPDISPSKQAMVPSKDLKNGLKLLLALKMNELSEMDGRDFLAYNQLAVQIAILDGQKKVRKIVDNQYKTVKVADIIGCNPAEMNVLERLDAVDKIEFLKNEHVGKLVNESITAMQKIMRKPKSADHFAAASEGIAILEGKDTYQRSPDKPDVDGSFSTIPKEDYADCLEKRLEQFRCHYEGNKKFLSDKPIIKLINFIENIKSLVNNFGKKLKQPKLQEVTNSDNAQQNQRRSSQLKKRSLSESNLLSTTSSVGMWLNPKPISSETDQEDSNIPEISNISAPPAA